MKSKISLSISKEELDFLNSVIHSEKIKYESLKPKYKQSKSLRIPIKILISLAEKLQHA